LFLQKKAWRGGPARGRQRAAERCMHGGEQRQQQRVAGGAMRRPILKAATYLRNTHSKSTDDFLVPRIRTPIIKAT